MLLTSASSFLTTEPPKGTILLYTHREPVICLAAAFALLIGGIIIGSGLILVIGKIRPRWFQRVRSILSKVLSILTSTCEPVSDVHPMSRLCHFDCSCISSHNYRAWDLALRGRCVVPLIVLGGSRLIAFALQPFLRVCQKVTLCKERRSLR